MKMEPWQDRVKIYYDAEFTGLHRNTSLISIGMVSQSGAYFYAEFNDYDKSQVSDWIQEHVIGNLQFNDKETYRSIKIFEDGILTASRGRTPRAHSNIVMKGNKVEVMNNLYSWLREEYQAYGSTSKIQFFTDCYAYDWMTLMDLICEGGDALKVPEFIDYIPIDLSTAMYMNGIDPDMTREDFVGESIVKSLQDQFPIACKSGDIKHNSLWDALVCLWCFNLVSNPNRDAVIEHPKD